MVSQQGEVAGESERITVGGTPGSGVPSAPLSNWRARLGPYSLLLVLAAEYLVFTALRPETFLGTDTIQTILSSQAPLLLATLALTAPLITNEFDLTVGANLVVADVLLASLTVNYHVPLGLACAITLAFSTFVGVVNALIVVGIGINSFIATLGVSTLLTGAAYAVSGSEGIISNVPRQMSAIANTQFLGLPATVYYAFGLALILWYVYERTPLGRYLYFIGANIEVARLSGLPTRRIKAGAFVATGLIVGFAGLMEAGTIGSADPAAGPSFLLPAFAACFLGATAVRVGRFNVWGTMIASYLLFTGITGLALLGLTGWVQDAFNGTALLVAIIAARAFRQRASSATG